MRDGGAMEEGSPTLERLEDQLRYYGDGSRNNKFWYTWLKVVEIIAAALVPFLAGIWARPALTAGMGVLIVVLEGVQGLFQFQQNWIGYRSTAEELKHEKYLWLARAGPYTDPANRDLLLAERIEALVSREHAKWVSIQEKPREQKPAES